VFDAGSARDTDKAGLASMTNVLLDHGAGDWNTDEISERFDSVGAQFSLSAQRDMAIVNLRSLTDEKWLQKALETLAVVLQKPRFDENELNRERQRVMVALHNQQEDPGDVAELAFYDAVYGKHPYASPVLGTEASLLAITRDDIEKFYRQYYVAKNAVIVIVGAVDKKQAASIAEQLMSGLNAGAAAEALPQVSALDAAKSISKQHPSSQTHILVGQPGKDRKDPDYFALYVGNHILGGSGFGSRVVEEIREKRGLAYSSYTYFAPMRVAGPFVMGLQTRNDQAQQALDVLMQTLNKFIAEGPTEEELVSAKNNITGGFALRLDSNKDITEYVAMIGFYDLPLDYLTAFNSRVEAVTVAQIRDAFKRRVQPDKMVTVMVGDQGKEK
jgi:zinc protease